MKKFMTLLAVAAMVLVAGNAFAGFTNVRPDASLAGKLGSLQTFFNGQPGAINAYTDQEPWAIWQTTSSNTSTFTLRLEMAAFAGSNKFGIYNYGSPAGPLFEVFNGAAGVGYFSTATFNAGGVIGDLRVNYFNSSAAFIGTQLYNGVNSKAFGFYLDSRPNAGGGLFYSEDVLNESGKSHNLAYAGQAEDAGQWWLAWEDLNRDTGSDEDFTDMVVFAESINPAVPEPGTLALFGFGLAGSALAYRRRRSS